jgi:cobalt/nickel transport system permease protein
MTLAMHITEGILPALWAALWFAVAAPFVAWGLWTVKRRRLADPKYMAMVSLMGAAIFVVSCAPIPIPWVNSCSHPCGTGLGAIMIGTGPTIVVTSVALLIQALFLAHGGLSTLGANIVSMGVVGSLSAVLVFRGLRLVRVPVLVAVFAAGCVSDWGTYATTSFALASALHGDASFWSWFAGIALAFVPTQLPLGLAEGIVASVAYKFVLTRRPELLELGGMAAAVEEGPES